MAEEELEFKSPSSWFSTLTTTKYSLVLWICLWKLFNFFFPVLDLQVVLEVPWWWWEKWLTTSPCTYNCCSILTVTWPLSRYLASGLFLRTIACSILQSCDCHLWPFQLASNKHNQSGSWQETDSCSCIRCCLISRWFI